MEPTLLIPTSRVSTNTNNMTPPVVDTELDGVSIAYICIEFLLTISIVSSNSLVILAVYKFHRLKTVTNQFIVNLAVTDIMVGALMPWLATMFIRPSLMYVEAACYLNHGIIHLATQESIMTLMLVALDRYIAVIHPLRYHQLVTPKGANIMILCSWIYSMVWAGAKVLSSKWSGMKPVPVCVAHLLWDKTFVLADILQFSLFTIILIVMYARIFYVAYRQANKIRLQMMIVTHANMSRSHQRNTKSAKVLCLVIGVFLACFIPWHFSNFVTILLSCDSETCVAVRRFAFLLSVTNSTCNPFIYAWKNADFRRAFEKMLRLHVICKCSCATKDRQRTTSTLSSRTRTSTSTEMQVSSGPGTARNSGTSQRISTTTA